MQLIPALLYKKKKKKHWKHMEESCSYKSLFIAFKGSFSRTPKKYAMTVQSAEQKIKE